MRRVRRRPVSDPAYASWLGSLAKGPVASRCRLQILRALRVRSELASLRRGASSRAGSPRRRRGRHMYALALAEGGREFFAKQVLDENVYRFLGSEKLTGGHRHSVGYLAGMLLLGLLPWSLFLPSVAADLWRNRSQLGRRDPRLFALLWTLLVFAFYAQAASKRGVYLLPIYPALCLLLGSWVSSSTDAEDLDGARSRRWLARVGRAARVLLAALLGALAVATARRARPSGAAGWIDLAARRSARDASHAVRAAARPPPSRALHGDRDSLLRVAAARPARRWVPVPAVSWCPAAATLGVRQVVLPAVAEADTLAGTSSPVRRFRSCRGLQRPPTRLLVRLLRSAAPVPDGVLSADAPSPLSLRSDWCARDATRHSTSASPTSNGRACNLGSSSRHRLVRESAGAARPKETVDDTSHSAARPRRERRDPPARSRQLPGSSTTCTDRARGSASNARSPPTSAPVCACGVGSARRLLLGWPRWNVKGDRVGSSQRIVRPWKRRHHLSGRAGGDDHGRE